MWHIQLILIWFFFMECAENKLDLGTRYFKQMFIYYFG